MNNSSFKWCRLHKHFKNDSGLFDRKGEARAMDSVYLLLCFIAICNRLKDGNMLLIWFSYSNQENEKVRVRKGVESGFRPPLNSATNIALL
jgi:hypothetical protein